MAEAWALYVCPSCKRYTTDSDQIDCECDVDHWDELTVVPAPPSCDRLHCNDTIGPCEDCPRQKEL